MASIAEILGGYRSRRSGSILAAPSMTVLALARRWRSSPQHQKRTLIGLTLRAWPILTEGPFGSNGPLGTARCCGESCSRAWQEPFCYLVLQAPQHLWT